MRRLRSPRPMLSCPDAVEPSVLLETVLGCFNVLVHAKACDRQQNVEGAGEFRAIIFGSVSQEPSGVLEDWRTDPSFAMTLTCPNWASLGWRHDYFQAVYREQRCHIHLIAYQQLISRPTFQNAQEWIADDKTIVVHLTPSTSISTARDGRIVKVPCKQTLASLTKQTTVLVDAVFYCGWNSPGQSLRVFSVEALNIQTVHGKERGVADKDVGPKDVVFPRPTFDEAIPELAYP
ncbi:hypothetical protein DFH09DRAFT_1079591 [Mycena vulgaris]|nr:hypothetical protein DFH09DRAFT_1079591 [Mycena vulgaris]